MIAVHFGLGNYNDSPDIAKDFHSQMKTICSEACVDISRGDSSLDVVCHAVSMLENCKYTNAGAGSCLTAQGVVEMEASIMDGTSNIFGGVSCIRNYHNPVKIAKLLVDFQRQYVPKGLVKPQHLSGIGAEEFAHKHNLSSCDPMTLITKQAVRQYDKLKELIDSNIHEASLRLDTVGAISVDLKGNISVAASSGGTPCRHEGRIGHVSQPSGSGIWVDQNSRVAACTTGLGEILARDVTAKNICRIMAEDSDIELAYRLQNHIVKIKDKNPTNWASYVGALGVKLSENGSKSVLACIRGSKLLVGYSVAGSQPAVKIITPCEASIRSPVIQEWQL